jgi:hypothetical protein
VSIGQLDEVGYKIDTSVMKIRKRAWRFAANEGEV